MRSNNIELPEIILGVDWGKNSVKRAVYVADVSAKRISRLASSQWTLESVLSAARDYQCSVLISMDLVLGVPRPYWNAVLGVEKWKHCTEFLSWLATLERERTIWQEVISAEAWNVLQPFFRVPGGAGSMTAFHEEADYPLFRKVDIQFQAKSPFCVSGIPGTVGAGTRALWMELSSSLAVQRDFQVWPFEGPLSELLAHTNIVVAEGYPAISYTAALQERLPARRLKVAKTKRHQRKTAIELLTDSSWVNAHSVMIENLDEALESEDDFDAMMSATGLLRCILEGYPLEEPSFDDPIAEGGVLLTSVIDLERKTEVLRRSGGKSIRPTKKTSLASTQLQCPIPGCTKVFKNGRGGWDAHVASMRTHPEWFSEIDDPYERKAQFQKDFPAWFAT